MCADDLFWHVNMWMARQSKEITTSIALYSITIKVYMDINKSDKITFGQPSKCEL